MFLQIGDDIHSGGFFHLQTADVDAVNPIGVDGFQVVLFKGVLHAVIHDEGPLSAVLHHAVAAAVFSLWTADVDGNAPLFQMLAHVVTVDASTHGGAKAIGRLKMAQNVRNQKGAAAQRTALLFDVYILTGDGQVGNLHDDIHYRRSDDQGLFHIRFPFLLP